ncbi:MAG: HAD family hydrolase [Planctomycetia bacterium]|nr:HAD family hydrolase [Planctomycetia bacterium]
MIKAVLFDFDGTVADTLVLCIEAFKNAVESFTQNRLTDQEIIASFGPSEEGSMQLFLPTNSEQGVDAYIREYKALHYICPDMFPGMKELLQFLKEKNIFLGLVTGKGPRSCEVSLKYYGIETFFDWVETGSPLGPCKPEGIRRFLNHFHLTPQESVYIGDAPSDITASREVGIPVISVGWASTANPIDLKKMSPDALCMTISDLKKLLCDWLKLE